MPSRHPARRFTDIIDNIDAIERHLRGVGEAEFLASELLIDAVERCLSRLSEAAVKLDDVAEQLAPDIPWSDIRGLGNRLRHFYDTIEPKVIWAIVSDDLPPLRAACDKALVQIAKTANDADP